MRTENERDLILSLAAERTINVDPPNAVIIPGYTGITLSKDASMWITSGLKRPPYVTPSQIEFVATLKGIPSTQPVTWECDIPLTDTPNPLIKIIQAINYPSDYRFTNLRVTVPYAGQVFEATMVVACFNG